MVNRQMDINTLKYIKVKKAIKSAKEAGKISIGGVYIRKAEYPDLFSDTLVILEKQCAEFRKNRPDYREHCFG